MLHSRPRATVGHRPSAGLTLSPCSLCSVHSRLSRRRQVIRSAITHFASRGILPVVNRYFSRKHFPHRLVPRVTKLKLLNSSLPARCNYTKVGTIDCNLVYRRLRHNSSNVHDFISIRSSLYVCPVFTCNSRRRHRHFLPTVTQNRIVNYFNLARPRKKSSPTGVGARTHHSNNS